MVASTGSIVGTAGISLAIGFIVIRKTNEGIIKARKGALGNVLTLENEFRMPRCK
jgi:hypothetical protein